MGEPMKKHISLISAILIMTALAFSGCGSDFPEISEEQEEVVGEYAARLLLKYDANNRSRLLDREVVEEKEEQRRLRQEKIEEAERREKEMQEAKEQGKTSAESDTETEQIPVSQMSLEEVLGLPAGMSLSYQNYEITDSYSGGDSSDYFSMDATSGNQLLIFKFTLFNDSGTDQTINMLAKSASARVRINNSYSRNALITMLGEDLLTYDATVGSGVLAEAVVLFEVPTDQLTNIESMTLSLKNESNTHTIQAK